MFAGIGIGLGVKGAFGESARASWPPIEVACGSCGGKRGGDTFVTSVELVASSALVGASFIFRIGCSVRSSCASDVSRSSLKPCLPF